MISRRSIAIGWRRAIVWLQRRSDSTCSWLTFSRSHTASTARLNCC